MGPSTDYVASRTGPQGARNDPANILHAWTALEALSPQTYTRPEDLAGGDRQCVASLAAGLPWNQPEQAPEGYRIYYQVVLGAISMDAATERLVQAFGRDEERGRPSQQMAAIAAVLVDQNGVLVEKNSIAVSGFAWALPLALQLEIGKLGGWPEVEPMLVRMLTEVLRTDLLDGEPRPLDRPAIDRAFRRLVQQCGLPAGLVEPPQFAIRVLHHERARNPPEVQLLNSFFLDDLAKAAVCIRDGTAPEALRRYLGIEAPVSVVDLLADRAALEDAVSPRQIPAACWPSPGGHPLVLLQQAAVNLARCEFATRDGLIGVNGPPGTGKTTLLRDVVAAAVLDRAVAMAAFEDPESALIPTDHRIAAGETALLRLHRLDPSLKGHELLVASSTNKAVENVSRELPAAKAVGRGEFQYFRALSNHLYGTPGEDEDSAIEPIDTWGLIAAVLGNARNRAAFLQRFWWHEDYGLRQYLKAAKGDTVVAEIRDPATGKVLERRLPAIVDQEKPPSPQLAKANWARARKRLLALKSEVDDKLAELERVREICLRRTSFQGTLVEEEVALATRKRESAEAEQRLEFANASVDAARADHRRHCTEEKQSLARRPWWWLRLFRTQRWREWHLAHAPLAAAVRESKQRWRDAERRAADTRSAAVRLQAELRGCADRLAQSREQLRELTAAIEQHRVSLGERIVDSTTAHLTAPWLPEELHRRREDLFMAALDVHRTFVDAAAARIMPNLGALMMLLNGRTPPDDAARDLLADLWSTLFLVVPVVSTTFASMGRMFRHLPPGSIGWLLVDEAGQAAPQAAVGAILRARRAVVIGDPRQIPPVVTLPERLTAEIGRFFGVGLREWIAPEASVQTLADRGSAFQTQVSDGIGVGIPLLVHRRCQEPMFSIANRIAYAEQMIQATPARPPDPVGEVLGPSTWFDIDGDADSKWCPAEGEFVIGLLRRLAAAGIATPDLFIITPFRIVAAEMRRRLRQEAHLTAQLGIEGHYWGNDRIGTIHTFQGREANTVILILGAPNAAQHGARNWAAGTPNILNVAVSRAKQNLYVVGSYAAWVQIGYAQELARLPRSQPLVQLS